MNNTADKIAVGNNFRIGFGFADDPDKMRPKIDEFIRRWKKYVMKG